MTEFDATGNRDSDGKTERYLRLFSENQGRIYAYILSLCPNRFDADDIMQDTVSVMWRKFDDYSGGTDFIAWAITIAKYTTYSFRRKQKKGHLHFDENTIKSLENKSERLTQAVDRRVDALQGCVEKLPDNDVKLLKLRYFDELSVKVIAARFEMTTRSIYKKMSKIHLALIQCIKRSLAREAIQ